MPKQKADKDVVEINTGGTISAGGTINFYHGPDEQFYTAPVKYKTSTRQTFVWLWNKWVEVVND